MFDRAWLKTVARNRMRAGKSNAILVMLVLTLLGAVESTGVSVDFTFNSDSTATMNVDAEYMYQYMERFIQQYLPIILTVLLVSLCVALVITLLFTNVLACGGRGWYLRYVRGENPDVGEAFAAFRIYKPVLCTTALRALYTALWSLLLVIPGIVKAYGYSMADYIIYENPNISASRALQMSEKMTDGAKTDLFIFDLSYIGWQILNGFTLGILGVVYVNPYKYTAHAAIYDALKWRAIGAGLLTWEDFGQLPPQEAAPAPQPVTYDAF